MALLIPQRNSTFCVLLVLAMLASRAAPSRTQLYDASMRQKHESWMARHGRNYKDEAEKEERFNTFKSNSEFIDSFNRAGNRSYTMGVNQFTDLTDEEFRASYTGYIPMSHLNASKATSFGYKDVSEVPTSVNWRQKGAVTGVKDQQQCGCCWAFSTIAAVEGVTKLKTGHLISLSEQQLLDCSTNGGNRGCGGGSMDNAFSYIMQNHGISSEESYPYEGFQGTCNPQKEAASAATISSFQQVPPNSEEALMEAVANQPVSIAIEGSGMYFKNYRSGIFDGDCGTNLDHAVTVIGYGASEEGKYWLIKNSWGAQWGEDGYMRLRRGVEDPQGLCGMAMHASYPVV